MATGRLARCGGPVGAPSCADGESVDDAQPRPHEVVIAAGDRGGAGGLGREARGREHVVDARAQLPPPGRGPGSGHGTDRVAAPGVRDGAQQTVIEGSVEVPGDDRARPARRAQGPEVRAPGRALPTTRRDGVAGDDGDLAAAQAEARAGERVLREDRTYCETFERNGGYDVYLPPTGLRERIRSTGDIGSNARELNKWVREKVPGKPLYVGYSMGGLIARKAISSEGAPAAGLLTVGAPHGGSFIADILAGVALSRLPFSTPAVVAAVATAPVGPEFTTAWRLADRMSTPGVPVWAFAGSKFSVPGGSYLSPNDGVVSRASAWGDGTALNPAARNKVQGAVGHVPEFDGGGPGQAGSGAVAQLAVNAAGAMPARSRALLGPS